MIKRLTTSALLLCIFTAQAYAAGGNSDGYEAKSGLPQLDTSTYASQIFWMIIVFVFMHIVFSKQSLPKISKTIGNRTDRIQSDLDTAETLKDEVDAVQSAYEDSLSGARSDSAALFKGIEQDIKDRTDAYAEEFAEKSIKEVETLEKNINKARKKAMEEMSVIAAEIASDAAEKIIGVRPDDKSVEAIVKSLNKAA